MTRASEARKRAAKRALALLDLTDLSDAASDAATERLGARAMTAHGHVAALCIYPSFVRTAKAALGSGSPVKVATVANFPEGKEDTSAVERETERSLRDGADEIDLVWPWRAFLAGRREAAERQIARVRRLIPEGAVLKVILETGELKSADTIAEASRIAIAAGAHMLKTSTGKVSLNATPEAAEIMLREIKASGAPVGFKAAGGIRTPDAAGTYLAIADRILGRRWATPVTFRLGASGLLDEILQVLDG